MKRVLVIALAIVCGVAFSEGFAVNPPKEKMSSAEIDAKLDSLRKEQAKLQALKDELDEYDKGKGPQPYRDSKEIYVPCIEESYDTDTELRGFGMGEDLTMAQAKQDALRKAVEDLSTKVFSESITSITISRPDETTESRVEYNITNDQKQFIKDNRQIQCCKFMGTEFGTYQAYIAVSISLNEIKQYKQKME